MLPLACTLGCSSLPEAVAKYLFGHSGRLPAYTDALPLLDDTDAQVVPAT